MSDRARIAWAFYNADLYRILALGFDEPTRVNWDTLRELVHELTEAIDSPSAVADPLRTLHRVVAATEPEHIRDEYQRLFVNQVAVPGSEGSYHRGERGAVIGDVAGFYQAFHVGCAPQSGPPDQLKMELGFCCFLALKEAKGLADNQAEAADIAARAARKFLQDHLGRWVPAFAARLEQNTDDRFYRCLTALLRAWITHDCDRRGLQIVPLEGNTDAHGEPVVGSCCPCRPQ